MKRLLFILALSVSLGAVAYLVSYGIAQRALCESPDWQSPTAWMRQEFHLNDAQYAQVKKMESDYHPHCTIMCDRIEQSHLALKKIILASNGMTPDVQAALLKDAAIQEECREDMLSHFYEVSQALPPDQAKRYLEIMQAHVVETENASQTAMLKH
jgi:hypothetical protein